MVLNSINSEYVTAQLMMGYYYIVDYNQLNITRVTLPCGGC